MYRPIKRLALLFIISGALVSAKADTITQVFSSASTTSNNSISLGLPGAGATENIVGNSAWAAPFAGSSWVSFTTSGSTGSGFVSPPNGTAVTFSQTFLLNGPVTSAYLDVLADDTATVMLNGVTIYSANLGGSYPTCSSLPIGCLTSTEGVFNTAQLAPYLKDNGSNTLAFVVYQEAGVSYGLDYAGGFTVKTPEPTSLALLGAGFLGLALLKLRS